VFSLSDIKRPYGAVKKRKRVGRGESSGWGKTAGRGGKGQTARTGKGKPGWGFEGGQMPMYRRMPKRGFTNIFAKPTVAINLDILVKRCKPNDVITLERLRAWKLADRKHVCARILGRGEVNMPLIFEGVHVTQGALTKITAAGGAVR
jgi:large subunit ribosomal protein L15